MTAEALTSLIKQEILADVEAGIVAADVAGLSDVLRSIQYRDDSDTMDILLDFKRQAGEDSSNQLRQVMNAAMDNVDHWIKSGGIASVRRSLGAGIALVQIDQLIQIEGDEPALGWTFSLNQYLNGSLSEAAIEHIKKDIATIEYWRGVYKVYVGREKDLLSNESALIKVFDPAIRGKRIADGFHRLAAAKLAGLERIGAHIAPWFKSSALTI